MKTCQTPEMKNLKDWLLCVTRGLSGCGRLNLCDLLKMANEGICIHATIKAKTIYLVRRAQSPWDSCTQPSPPAAWSVCPPGPGKPWLGPWRKPHALQTWGRSGSQLQPTTVPCEEEGQTGLHWGWTARSSSASAMPPGGFVMFIKSLYNFQ